jgi:Holliday junction resolvase RusA-like endonuclease
MEPIRETKLEIHPSTHVRSTRNESWLFRVEDDYLANLDKKKLIEKGKMGGLLRRKKQLEVHNAHKEEIRYWVQKTGFVMPTGAFAIWFYVPMPPSWRKKKREAMIHTVHQSTPDLDNFLKQMFDSVMPRRNRIAGEKGADDRKIFNYAAFKVWVDWPDACVKILEYDQDQFMHVFRHGHPMYKKSPQENL